MRTLTVLVESLAKEKILAFAEAVTTEIGGLMAVHQEGHTLTITDAWTVPQEVSVGAVLFDVGPFEDYIRSMGWANGKPMPHICMGTWHSHGNGGVFWSGTDENDISRKYAMRGFLVNVVVNRKGDWLCQVDSMVGPENGKPGDYVLVTVPSTLKLVSVRDAAITAQVNAEIATNVRERAVGFFNPGHGAQDWGLLEGEYYGKAWAKHNKASKAPKEPKNRELFSKARERVPILGGVWSINNKTKCMEKWSNGKCIAIIDNMGDGQLTLYDDEGNTLATDRTFGRRKSFTPPAEL